MVVAALGSVSNKNARGWYHSLEARGWGAAFTAGVAAVGASHEAVGSPQEAEDALPEVEVAAVSDAESDEEDLDLDECRTAVKLYLSVENGDINEFFVTPDVKADFDRNG